MDTTAPSPLPVIHLDTLSFVGLERSHLRSAVYRRVFGDDAGPVRIGRYSLLERVGAGARGVVFKAFDNQLDRLVALKVLSTRADDHEELIREAKALARLSHPNVLPVYEVGETEDGQVFLAAEYVKGWTLRGWYDEETRGEAAIVDVIRQVARGVQAAHDEGLVHRDLKPANILLGEDGRVRVADFGLARFDPSALAPAADVPRDGLATTTAGTPGYMAPELFRGDPASAASDQYALAVTLHELLFGALPEDASSVALRRASKTVASAVRRGLASAPEDRFPTVGAFADALVSSARSPLRRPLPWLLAASPLAVIGATLWLTEPVGERAADNELALLQAKANLPVNPSAALEELQKAPDPTDPRLLPTTERALALGPERARYELPVGAHDTTLLGDVFTFWNSAGELKAYRLGPDGPSAVQPRDFGITVTPRDANRIMILDGAPWNLDVADPAQLAQGSPWAARAYRGRFAPVSTSEDGKRVARLDREAGSLVVEDTATGEVLWSHEQLEGRFRSATLAPDGKRVAWVDENNAAFVLELSTGFLRSISRPAAKVWFEPGRDSVVVRAPLGGLFQVDLGTGQSNGLLDLDLAFGRVELSPGGEWIAAQAQDEKISVTNLIASAPKTIRGNAFQFSPDGSRLVTRDAGALTVHDLASGDQYSLTAPGEASQFSFTDENTVWSVGADGRLRSFEVPASTVLRGHTGPIRSIVLSNDGSVAVSSAGDYTIRTWDVASGTSRLLTNLDSVPSTLALDEASARVIVTQHKAPTSFIDLRSGEVVGEAPQSSARPVLGPEGAVFGAGKEGVWSYKDGHASVVADDVGRCSAIAATPEWVGAVCRDEGRKIHVWRGDDHDSIPVEGPVTFGTSSLHAWPDASHLYFLGNRESLIRIAPDGLEDLESPHRLRALRSVHSPAASNSSHDLIVSTSDGILALWDPTSAAVQIASVEPPAVVAVSGNGRRVAYSTPRQQIVVRDRAVSKGLASVSATLEGAIAKGGSL